MFIKYLKSYVFMKPEDEHGSAGASGGSTEVDRGDFLPENKDEAAAKADADAELARIEAEKAEKAKKNEEKDDKGAKVDASEEEEEEEEEDEEEEEKGDKSDKEDKKAKKDTRIPLSRHKQIIEKERAQREALEAELAQYKGGEQVAKVNEKIDAAETKLVEMEGNYNKLVIDGEAEKAAKLMGDIRKLEREIIEQKSMMAAQAAEARAYERVKLDTVIDRLEEAFPVLDPKHESYDAGLVGEVLEMMEFYQTKGHAPAAAMQKAVDKLVKSETAKQESAVNTTPRVDADKVAEKIAKERKTEATKRGLDAAGKTPTSPEKGGMDSDKLGGTLDAKNAMKLSQDEFAKLDEKTLSKMRGDTL